MYHAKKSIGRESNLQPAELWGNLTHAWLGNFPLPSLEKQAFRAQYWKMKMNFSYPHEGVAF